MIDVYIQNSLYYAIGDRFSGSAWLTVKCKCTEIPGTWKSARLGIVSVIKYSVAGNSLLLRLSFASVIKHDFK